MQNLTKHIFFLSLILSIHVHSQDQIEYLDGDKVYVDNIDNVKNDSITYTHYKKTRKEPLSKIKGYYLTIDTKDNLKRGFHRREREYYAVDSAYHGAFYSNDKRHRDVINDYIQSCLPSDLSTLIYREGYYINYDLDTVHTLVSDFNDSDFNNVVFISKIDSQDYKIFTPLLVKGYSINDQVYISYFPDKVEDKETYLFIRQEISGKINLFKKPSLPYHDGNYYLVNKENSDVFYHICPHTACISEHVAGYQKIMLTRSNYSSSGYYYVATNPNLDNSFNKVMPQLVSDCTGLSNRIRSEFYTKADIVTIIEKYNSGCY